MKESAKTEKELREAKDPHPQTEKDLKEYIHTLVNREHDYGTAAYAMSLAAIAAFNFVAHKLGTTGFQASCADLDFLQRTRNLKCGFRLIDCEKLLYPQYLNEKHFPSATLLLKQNKVALSEQAKKLLAEGGLFHPDVKRRMKYVAALVPVTESKAH